MAWIDNFLMAVAALIVLLLVWCAAWALVGAPEVSLIIMVAAAATAAFSFGERRLRRKVRW